MRGLRRHGGSGGHRHGAGLSLGVGMGNHRRQLSLFCSAIGVSGKKTANGGCPHRSAIAVRTAAKECRCDFAPVCTLQKLHEQASCATGITPMRLLSETVGKGLCQGTLFNAAMRHENLDDGERHMGVIGPGPWSGREIASPQYRW